MGSKTLSTGWPNPSAAIDAVRIKNWQNLAKTWFPANEKHILLYTVTLKWKNLFRARLGRRRSSSQLRDFLMVVWFQYWIQ
jgi:hypothetical protein